MKKNVSGQVIGAQLVSATDGSAFTGSVTVYVTGDGGVQATGAVGSGACVHEGNGFHTYAPAQAETNYDHVAFTFTGSGAVPVTVQVYPTFPQTGDSFSRIGSNGAGLTSLPWNAAWDAEVESEVTDALNTYDPPTNAEFEARTLPAADYFAPSTDTVTVGTNNDKTGYSISGTITTLDALDAAQDSQHTATQLAISNLNDLSAAEVNAEVDTALADYDALVPADLPDNFAALGINASGHIERVTLVDTTTANTDMRGTDSAYTGTPPTAASIADAVWDEAQTDHDGAGTFGAYLDASVSGVSTGGVSASDIADAVWDEALSGHVDAGSAGAELAATYSGTPPTAESISTQVASDLASAHGSGSWTTGDAAPTVDEIAARLLATPANKLATNSDGSVNATVSGVDVDEEALADALIDAGVASQASVDAVAEDVAGLTSNSGVASAAPARRAGNRVEVEIVRGDTYEDGLADGALDFDEQAWWPTDLTGATITLTARHKRGRHDTTDPEIVLSKTGTVVAATTPQKVRVELTATESAAATVGTHEYDVQATLTTGEVVTLAGPGWPFVVRADQTV